MNIFKLGIKFLFHIFSNFEIKYVMDFNVHCAAAAGKAEFVLVKSLGRFTTEIKVCS